MIHYSKLGSEKNPFTKETSGNVVTFNFRCFQTARSRNFLMSLTNYIGNQNLSTSFITFTFTKRSW